jgi:hypothetical protein
LKTGPIGCLKTSVEDYCVISQKSADFMEKVFLCIVIGNFCTLLQGFFVSFNIAQYLNYVYTSYRQDIQMPTKSLFTCRNDYWLFVINIKDACTSSDSTAKMPKKNSGTQTAKFVMEVMMKSKERDSEISESGLNVSSDEIVENFKQLVKMD